ncbi:MAG TPA: hypothetical protein VIL84_12810 [Devosiaceae bacterium]
MTTAKALLRGIAVCCFALLPSLALSQQGAIDNGIQRVVSNCMTAAHNGDSAACVALVDALIAEWTAAGEDASALARDIAALDIALVDAARAARLEPAQLSVIADAIDESARLDPDPGQASNLLAVAADVRSGVLDFPVPERIQASAN